MHQWLPVVKIKIPVLTNGAIPAILENQGLYNKTAILQVLDYKGLLQATNNNRYKIVLSDGQYSYAFVMLAAQLNHLITDEKMEIFAVVKVVRFSVNSFVKKSHAPNKVYNKIITLHDVELLVPGKEVGVKLGNPQEFHYGEEVPEDLLTDPIKPVCLGNTNIERIRSGLICVHSQWEKLQMKDKDKSFSDAPATRNVQTSSQGKSQQPQSSFLGISPAGSTFHAFSATKASIQKMKQTSTNVPRDLGAQQVQKVSSTQNSVNAVPASNGNMEYIVDFMIDGHKYNFKASFAGSHKKIIGSLALWQIAENSSLVSKGGKHTIETNDKRNTVYPCAVWANLNGEQKKLCHLKKSWISDRYWVSEEFDGRFLLPISEFGNWKPLTCLLWIEFETYSGGERNALKQLTEMYVQQNQCDVQFSFKDDQRIGGHSHILTARSPVFAAMFQHEMTETKTGQVSIQDITQDIFKQLLHYIYSGRLLSPLTEASAQPLFVAADKYDIGDLKEECVSFLLTCIRVDNVINLMSWADLHFVDELKQLALKFVVLNAKEICILKDFEELTKNYPYLCVLVTRQITDRMSMSLNDEEELICSGLKCL